MHKGILFFLFLFFLKEGILFEDQTTRKLTVKFIDQLALEYKKKNQSLEFAEYNSVLQFFLDIVLNLENYGMHLIKVIFINQLNE